MAILEEITELAFHGQNFQILFQISTALNTLKDEIL